MRSGRKSWKIRKRFINFLPKRDKIAYNKKYGPPALFVVVCIPLTGVGCWIGSTLARLTDMDEKRAGLAILGGTLVSGLITILGVYGLIGGIQYLLK